MQKAKIKLIAITCMIITLVACAKETVNATTEKPFKGNSVKESIQNKNYTLNYTLPKDLKKTEEAEIKKIYFYKNLEIIVMLILNNKTVPRWAYYKERKSYQNRRVRNGISINYSGNITLGGFKNTYYYLKEKRIDRRKKQVHYLVFFERYYDNLPGPNNVLVKAVLRSKTKQEMEENLNIVAFIFRTFKMNFTNYSAE